MNLWRSPQGVQAVRNARVSGGFFRRLGVSAKLGRVFTDADNQTAAPRAVVLMYDTWQSRFGGRPDIIGQSLILENLAYAVIGVLPPEFHFAPRAAEFFVPIHDPNPCIESRGCRNFEAFGRLRDGVPLEAATAEVKAIAARLEREYPESNKGQSARLEPFRDAIVGGIRPTLLVLTSGAGCSCCICKCGKPSVGTRGRPPAGDRAGGSIGRVDVEVDPAVCNRRHSCELEFSGTLRSHFPAAAI